MEEADIKQRFDAVRSDSETDANPQMIPLRNMLSVFEEGKEPCLSQCLELGSDPWQILRRAHESLYRRSLALRVASGTS